VHEEDVSSGAFAKIGGGAYFGHDRVENHHEALVVNTVLQRKVHAVVLALLRAYVFDISRA
jgi:hypothetical protein